MSSDINMVPKGRSLRCVKMGLGGKKTSRE